MPTYRYIPRSRFPRWQLFRQKVGAYARLVRERADGRDYTDWTVRLIRPLHGMKPGSVGVIGGAQDLGTRRARHYVFFEETKVLVRMTLPSRKVELNKRRPGGQAGEG